MPKLSILFCTCRTETTEEYTRKLLPTWAELVVVKNDGSKPIGYYRNEAVLRAKGEYVAVIDDDDLITKDYFSEIKKGIDKGVDVVCTSHYYFKDKIYQGLIVSGEQNPILSERRDEVLQMLFAGHFCPTKREHVFGVGNYDVALESCEDFDLIGRLIPVLKTAYYVPYPVYKQYKSTHKKDSTYILSTPKAVSIPSTVSHIV